MVESSQPVILSTAKDPSASGTLSLGFFAAPRTTVAWVLRAPVLILDFAIWLYQRTLSPALVALNPTCGCRFVPTCSHYARGALREHGFLAGLVLTVIRLAKCGPWHPGGEDQVPSRARPVCTRISPS
jgi:putative membrane protein insertion efficiency factor